MPRVEAARVVSFRAPTQVGMKMVEGPWFFAGFAGGWTFTPASEGGTAVTWRYTCTATITVPGPALAYARVAGLFAPLAPTEGQAMKDLASITLPTQNHFTIVLFVRHTGAVAVFLRQNTKP